jgi:hypothetical protein
LRAVADRTRDKGVTLTGLEIAHEIVTDDFVIRKGDFLKAKARGLITWEWGPRSDVFISPAMVIANPPWNPAKTMLAHVEKMHKVFQDAIKAVLLPINFICSTERLEFNLKNPPDRMLVPAPRPRFVGGGGMRDVAWFVWDERIEEHARGVTCFDYNNYLEE